MTLHVLVEENSHELISYFWSELCVINACVLVLGLEWIVGFQSLSYFVLVI